MTVEKNVALVVKTIDEVGDITVNRVLQPWEKNHWVLKKRFHYFKEYHEEPDKQGAVQIVGTPGFNFDMNGYYDRQTEPHEGRNWYKKIDSNWHIRWYPKKKLWLVSAEEVNKPSASAFLSADILTCTTVVWQIYDGKTWIQDKNIKIIYTNNKTNDV